MTLYLNEKTEGKSRCDRFPPQRLFINNFVFLNHCGTNRRRVTDSNLHPLAAGGCGCSLSAIVASNAAEKLCLRLPLRACPARCSHGRRHRNRRPGPVRAPGPSTPRSRLRGPKTGAQRQARLGGSGEQLWRRGASGCRSAQATRASYLSGGGRCPGC